MSNGPSNIRINPFVGSGGATTYVNLTETHIIPSVSPFVIRLNEVPEKRDPSNMRCVYVDDTTGAVTSSALTEVAATPAAGQFRPDYSTKADKDDSWNTGLIEFNSADAGKIVQIAYTGMGTLAAVQSNKYPSWYTDRGDGSDGDFIPTQDTTISGVKNYKRVFIKAGVTVTIKKFARLSCLGAFVNKGLITLDGQGPEGLGGSVVASAVGKAGTSGGDGGAGGYDGAKAGGSGNTIFGVEYADRATIAGYILTVMQGYAVGASGASGQGTKAANGYNAAYGGKGGNGGGGICVVCSDFDNQGTITANGGAGGNATSDYFFAGGGGGGGGGGIIVICQKMLNKGNTSVAGGAGGTGHENKHNGANGTEGIVIIKELGVL